MNIDSISCTLIRRSPCPVLVRFRQLSEETRRLWQFEQTLLNGQTSTQQLNEVLVACSLPVLLTRSAFPCVSLRTVACVLCVRQPTVAA